jgi:hypothetical protein
MRLLPLILLFSCAPEPKCVWMHYHHDTRAWEMEKQRVRPPRPTPVCEIWETADGQRYAIGF